MLTDVTAQVHERRAAEARAAELSERYAQVRDLGILVQRALLSPSLPVLPGADIAAEYLVATQDTGAGGDWFEAMSGDSGTAFLVVGDVVGHGVEAAAVMAQLRTAIRLELLAGKSITESLTAVDDFSKHVPGSKAATLCIGRLDTHTGAFEYCTAGHPPPLLITGGAARFLEPSAPVRWAAGLASPPPPTTWTSMTLCCSTATASSSAPAGPLLPAQPNLPTWRLASLAARPSRSRQQRVPSSACAHRHWN